jgi:GTP-binding protein
MKNIRNIAIIAHVDHGKTTLVDALLKQSGTVLDKAGPTEQIMDSNELERERGITIFAKNASVQYLPQATGTEKPAPVKINILDTPGHADFGGEVERVLNMADGSLLLVDAEEGPMAQTRFVLKKALSLGHKIIVVINKIDKPNARVNHTLEKIIELFIELGATNEQINFPIVYASGRLGRASLTPELESSANARPLFEAILKYIPAPGGEIEKPLQMMIVSIVYDNYKGRLGIGRIHQGKITNGQKVSVINRAGAVRSGKITHLMTFLGLQKAVAEEIEAGDIAGVAGIEDITIGDCISASENPVSLPPITIEKPTVKAVFSVNNSPFAGQEGEYCTSRNLKERLEKELDNDVALRVEPGQSPDESVVSGRGELHLAILIEKMRREGYELQISRPEVIFREEDGPPSPDGFGRTSKTLEPAEDVWIEVPEKYSGWVIEKMSSYRKGELKNMSVENGLATFHFFVPTRGLIGFRNEFIIETSGQGIINSLFAGYFPKWEDINTSHRGSLVAHEAGVATTYGLLNAQERGVLFVGPGAKVYEGQVVGENAKDTDLVVNICKERQLTNFRAKATQVTDDLIPPLEPTLEQAMEYIGDDELVEVTPKSVRIRKRVLRNVIRK